MLLVHPEPVRVVCGIALLLRFVFLGEESHTHVLEGITAHHGPMAARDLSATVYLEPSCPCCGLVPVPPLGEGRAESCPQLGPFAYLSLSLQETKPAPSVFCMGALWDEVIGIPAAG